VIPDLCRNLVIVQVKRDTLREDIGFCYRKRAHMKLLQKRSVLCDIAEQLKSLSITCLGQREFQLPTKCETETFVAKGREALKCVERWLTDDHVGNHSRRGANEIKRVSEDSITTQSHNFKFNYCRFGLICVSVGLPAPYFFSHELFGSVSRFYNPDRLLQERFISSNYEPIL
jgi:hypothetical protein